VAAPVAAPVTAGDDNDDDFDDGNSTTTDDYDDDEFGSDGSSFASDGSDFASDAGDDDDSTTDDTCQDWCNGLSAYDPSKDACDCVDDDTTDDDDSDDDDDTTDVEPVAVIEMKMPSDVFEDPKKLKQAADEAVAKARAKDPNASAKTIAKAVASVNIPNDATDVQKTQILDAIEASACGGLDDCSVEWGGDDDRRRRRRLDESAATYVITLTLDPSNPVVPDMTVIKSELEYLLNEAGSTVVIGDVTQPVVTSVSVEIEVSADAALSKEEQDELVKAVADKAGIDVSELTIKVTVDDNCDGLEKAVCKSRIARASNNCRWDKREKTCAKKNADFVQPLPLSPCESPCCGLNMRACKGKGAAAKAWRREYSMNPRKACKFQEDLSMRTTTPDKRTFGQCEDRPGLNDDEKATDDNDDDRWQFSQVCNSPCCDLDKRACKGKGAAAKGFQRAEGKSPKRICMYLKSKTYRGEGMKSSGKCLPRDFVEETN